MIVNNGWEQVSILKYIDLVKSGVQSFSGKKKYIATGSLETGKIIDFIEVDYKSRPSRANMEVKENDILFAKMKDTEKIFLISKEDENNLYSTGFAVLRINNYQKDQKVLPNYVYYYLKSDYFQNQKNRLCSGATQKAINVSKLKKVTFLLPPIDYQKKMIMTLESIEQLKQWRQESDKLTIDYLNNIFYRMFKQILSKSERIKLIDISDKSQKNTFTNGPFGSNLLTSEFTNEGVPVIYIRDIRDGIYNRISTVYVTQEKAGSLSYCQVFPRDILITKVGDPPGTAAVYPEDKDMGIITQDVIRIRVNKDLINPYLIMINSSAGVIPIRPIVFFSPQIVSLSSCFILTGICNS